MASEGATGAEDDGQVQPEEREHNSRHWKRAVAVVGVVLLAAIGGLVALRVVTESTPAGVIALESRPAQGAISPFVWQIDSRRALALDVGLTMVTGGEIKHSGCGGDTRHRSGTSRFTIDIATQPNCSIDYSLDKRGWPGRYWSTSTSMTVSVTPGDTLTVRPLIERLTLVPGEPMVVARVDLVRDGSVSESRYLWLLPYRKGQPGGDDRARSVVTAFVEKEELVRTALEYLGRNRPEYGTEVRNLKAIVTEHERYWEVTWGLPEGTLGGTPAVEIDKATREVTKAYHYQ